MDFWQIFTLVTGVIYIVLEIRQKNFMWVVGIATSLAAMWVFFRQGLYASFGLNTYYFVTAFIGLWQWRRNKTAWSETLSTPSTAMSSPSTVMSTPSTALSNPSTAMSTPSTVMSSEVETSPLESDTIILNRLSWKTVIISAAVTVVGTLALMWGMRWLNETGLLKENPMSLLDSSVAVLSAVATWWLVKSYREQWLLWILADSLSVALCAMQGMWWMAALYVAYVVAAYYGLYYWKLRGSYLSDL